MKLAWIALLLALVLVPTASAQTSIYFNDFESGSLGSEWTLFAGDPNAHVQLIDNDWFSTNGWSSQVNNDTPAYSGVWRINMEASFFGVHSFQHATLAVDTSSATNVNVEFWWQEWSEENDPEDGLFVSDDGTTWYLLENMHSSNLTTWEQVSVDASAGAPSVNFNGLVYFRWQQFDDFEWGFDGIEIDDIDIQDYQPPPPPPSFNLPTGTQVVPLAIDFEGIAGGVLPPYMALTEIENKTAVPDPEAWANYGQKAPNLITNTGSFSLEMGLDPTSTNYHDVRNGLVMQLDGSQLSSRLELLFWIYQYDEEDHPFDGVFISNTGLDNDWHAVVQNWSQFPSQTWTQVGPIDLTVAAFQSGVSLNGPFFVLFAQTDNFPYGGVDGVAIDDIRFSTAGPQGPFLEILNLAGGANANFRVSNLTVGDRVWVGYSISGGGPTNTKYGSVDLSPPIRELPVMVADASGIAQQSVRIPPKVSGQILYSQAVYHDKGVSFELTNSVADLIQ